MKERIGIYGGTFAPIHNGHIRAALEFKRQFELDKLLIMPASLPPHKVMPKGDTVAHRLDMLKLVFDKEEYRREGIEISEYELNRPGKSYTVDTLKHFYAPNKELFFLCGTDMLLTLHQWKNACVIAELCTLVFARREDSDPILNHRITEQLSMLRSDYGFKVTELIMPALELSSSFIRNNITADLSEFLPAEVEEYIKKHDLYRNE